MASTSTSPEIGIELVTPGPEFFITPEPAMPAITVRALLPPGAGAVSAYHWTVTIVFDASKHPRGQSGNSATSSFTAATGAPEFTPVFPWIRGGDLRIDLKATIGSGAATATVAGLKIGGTNPALADVRAALPEEALRRMAKQESGGRQFLASADGGRSLSPLFSSDNLGGAGLLQITIPAPTQDEIWNWRANVAAARKLWLQKRAVASRFAKRCNTCAAFQRLGAEFNKARVADEKTALLIALPAYTPEQLELDTIRGYNGYSGRDPLGLPLHEFRARLEQGRLVVADNNDSTGTAQWERVPVADRPRSGDPNYVNHVLAQEPL